MAEKCGTLSCEFRPNTLDYVSAAHGGWGIVRMAALVPESHLLFVCPEACGRHNALGSALFGLKDRVHYLFLSDTDIISGDFEEMIVENVDTLFEILDERPKVLMIYTACIDDLLGTDHEPILKEVRKKYPDVKFRHCRMNPISLDTPNPPGITTNIEMYSLLEPSEKQQKAVNIIGTNVSYDDTNDLKQILHAKGYRVHHIADYERFEDFQEMARSVLNIVTAPISLGAAQMMEKKLGIPYIKAFVTYDTEEIMDLYEDLSEILQEDLVEPALAFLKKAEEKISTVKDIVGDYPIAIDYQAVIRPYSLALTLVRHGFHVGMVASDVVLGIDKTSYETLQKEEPDILVENPLDFSAVRFPHAGEKYLCIGFDCGYMTGSDRVVDLMSDDGLYTFDGVIRLMDMIAEAYKGGGDVGEMIVKAGLII